MKLKTVRLFLAAAVLGIVRIALCDESVEQHVALEKGVTNIRPVLFGEQNDRPLRIVDPLDVAVNSHGHVFVLTKHGHVYVFYPSGKFYTRWGQNSRSGKSEYLASAIDVDHIGDIALLDAMNSRILKYDITGRKRATLPLKAGPNIRLGMPVGLCIDTKGELYVSDKDHDRVCVFNRDGSFLKSIGTRGTKVGEFQNPSGVAVDLAGRIYVSDMHNHRIQIFNLLGKIVRVVEARKAADLQLQYPSDVAVFDRWQILAVADSENRRVKFYTFDAVLKLSLTITIPHTDKIAVPTKLTFDRKGNLFLIDALLGRVLKLDTAQLSSKLRGSTVRKEEKQENPKKPDEKQIVQ